MQIQETKKSLQLHPAAQPVPPMTSEEFAELKASMKANGFLTQYPIILCEGMILDGRHRYNAANELNIEPIFQNYTLEYPSEYVLAVNTRRNLNASQRAVWAANMVPLIQADKEKRRQAGEAVEHKRTNEVAAKAMGVSSAQVTKAVKLKKTDPDKFKAVAEGKTSLHKASTPDISTQEKVGMEKAEAIKRIGEICGIKFAQAVDKGTILKSQSETKRFADLNEEDMIRIQSLVQEGWLVRKALMFKMSSLSRAHRIKDLINRASAKGGKFTFTLEGWEISVKKI